MEEGHLMYHPVTFTKNGPKTIHKYKYPNTTSETTICGNRVSDVMDGFAFKNEDDHCEGCYES